MKRQATVINLDLVRFTRLTVTLGSETAHRILREVLRTVESTIYAYKPSYTDVYDRIEGDSFMFCFGLPQTSEDDAVRAARAALEAAAAVAALEIVPDFPLQVRVGIATGVVIVDPVSHDRPALKPMISGHTANLAARLRALANPGHAVVSDATARLIDREFDLVSLGSTRPLKGIGKVSAWLLAGPRAGNRLEALTRRNAGSLLVGRDREVTALLELWKLARSGLGQAVLISGEPGVGKTRLLGELYGRVGKECGAALHYQCYPYYQNSVFYPVIDHLQRWLARGPDTFKQVPLQALRVNLVEKLGVSEQVYQSLLDLLSPTRIARPAEHLELSGAGREATIEALIEIVRARVHLAGSAMLVLEDAQWSDPSTLQIVEALISRVAAWPVLVVVTFRPEFEVPEWSGMPITHLTLGRLDVADSSVLVSTVAAVETPLTARAVTRIVEKSDGIPLFIEELTKAVLESPALREEFDTDSASLKRRMGMPIPATLRDLITARLDRSIHAKTIAQIGAIIGRDFDDALLDSVVSAPGIDKRRGLDDLREAGLIFSRPSTAGTTHTFKHALIQDEARDSLLADVRQELHGRVARALETRSYGGGDVPPELLAHHYTEAGVPDRAAKYWALAGDDAAKRSANIEATHHFQRALDTLKLCPKSVENSQREIELHTALSRALIAAKGYASPEVARVFRRAKPLVRGSPNHEQSVILRWTEGQYQIVGARYASALERGLELVRDAAVNLHEENLAYARLLVGLAHLYLGEIVLARDHLERSAGIQLTDESLSTVRIADIASPSLAYLARAVWLLGQPRLAILCCERALELAQASTYPLLPTQVTGMRMLVEQARNDRASTRVWIDRTIVTAQERNHPYWVRLAQILDTWWLATDGDRTAARQMQSVLNAYFDTGARVGLSGLRALAAQAALHCGMPDTALEHCRAGLAFAKETNEAYFLPELHRLEALIELSRGGSDGARTAEPSFRVAIEIAQRQNALSWQLRSALDLARVWEASGKRAEARALLGAILGRFTEPVPDPDLTEAQKLLAALD